MSAAPADPVKWAAARTLLVTDKLRSVLSALDSVEIQPLVLHGPAVESPAETEALLSKPDIALLLRRGSAWRGRKHLQSQGWELLGFFPGGASLLLEDVRLNLHWRLRGVGRVRHRRLAAVLRDSATSGPLNSAAPAPWATALLVAAHPHGFSLASEHRTAVAMAGLQECEDTSGLWDLARRIRVADELRGLIEEARPRETDRSESLRSLTEHLGAISRRLRLRVSDRPLHPFSTDFCGMRLSLGLGVFHPQPSAEKLVEVAIGLLDDIPSPIVVDVGTGSGAVALALARARPDLRIYATDISPAAVRCARRNGRRLGLTNLEVLRGSLLEPVTELQGQVDAITAVLPYLPTAAAIEGVDLAPRVAIDGGSDDGLGLMRELARQAAKALRPGGRLIFQLAERQWDEFTPDLAAAGYANPELLVRWPGLVVLGTAQWRDGSNRASPV